MCQRGWSYVVKAGTIILVSNFIVYMMQSFNWKLQMVEDPSQSILAGVGTPIAYVIAPVVGVVMWQLAAAAVTGFVAKECVVGTLATCFAFEAILDEEMIELAEGANASAVAGAMGIGAVAALAFMMFNLFTPPCFAALGAMNSEIKSKKWLFAGIGLQFAIAYVLSFLVYQIGTLLTEGTTGAGFIPGLIAVAAIVAIVVYLIRKSDKNLKAEYDRKAQA